MKALLLLCLFTVSAQAQDRIIKLFQNNEYLENHITLFLDNGEIVHVPHKSEALKNKIINAYVNKEAIESSINIKQLIEEVYPPKQNELI